jgi:NtrC-family two-component system sensor histidine kinase KinB
VDVALTGLRRLLGRLAGPHIDLVVAYEDGLPPARFDGSAFRHVLIELVTSAAAAIPDRGRIAIHAERAAGRIVVTVADTGPGLAVDELPGIIEPFHETQKRAGGNAGLAAVHELIVSNGADIRVSSTPGGGAKLSIYLAPWAA